MTFRVAGGGGSSFPLTVTGGTSGAIPYFSNTTTLAVSALLGANQVVLGGGAGVAPFTNSGFTFAATGAAGEGVAIAAGTATTDVQAISTLATWNNGGVTFTAHKYTVIETATAAGSFHSLWLGGAAGTTTYMSLGKTGTLIIPNIISVGGLAITSGSFYASALAVQIYRDYSLGWSGTASTNGAADTSLSRISAGLIGVGTGAAASFAGRLKATSYIAAGVAIANLNAAPTAGEIQSVTDALVPVLGAVVAAGGAAYAGVQYNGAAWKVISL